VAVQPSGHDQFAEWCRCGHAEHGLVRIAFQPATKLLEVLDLGRDGRADEDTELEPRELADRNEILGRCRSKGGILIGIWDEQELAAIRANRDATGATNISRHNGERAFKKVSRCSLQQTEAGFVLLGVTTSGEKP
jgi:hypothetical protein